MSRQERNFKMHENLLLDVIQRQAGTVSKAIGELVMNAVDSGSSKVNIELSTGEFLVEDDGRGFVGKTEINDFFETFGTPHQEGDATYGRFRMGRGQIMAFSKNKWRSNEFEMDVDIIGNGLKYDLTEHKDSFNGCRITGSFYEKITPSELHSLKAELTKMVLYVQIPVTLNGERISKDVSEEKWDYETDKAYIKIRKTGCLQVYNLGVHVKDYPEFVFGKGGVIVSKEQLQVNFARNDIMERICPVWKTIKPFLKKEARKQAKKGLNAEMRDFLAAEIISMEEKVDGWFTLNLLTDIKGRHFSFRTLYNGTTKLTAEPVQKTNIASVIADKKIATVIARKTLERFGCETIDDLIDIAENTAEAFEETWWWKGFGEHTRKRICSFSDIANGFSDKHIVFHDSEINHNIILMLKSLRKATHHLGVEMSMWNGTTYDNAKRKIIAGQSETAKMWTDGKTFIAVDIETLKLMRRGLWGCMEIIDIMIHEYIHTSSDIDSHSHNFEFYEMFHNITIDQPRLHTDTAVKLLNTYCDELEKENKRKTSQMDRDRDNTFKKEAFVSLAFAKVK